MTFAIKAPIDDLSDPTLIFAAQKTMYGGKTIADGDVIFLFASENDGGSGLVGRGIAASVLALPRLPGIARQTPRVSLHVGQIERAKRALGRRELAPFSIWSDGRAETELNFKLYRQATNKVIGLSDKAAAFLAGFFEP
jgi:hypothetical protein